MPCLHRHFNIHGDTANTGKYGRDEGMITFGHAKDGRTDLKRFILNMASDRSGDDAKKAASRLAKAKFFCEANARSAAESFFSGHPLTQGPVTVRESRRRGDSEEL